jgi:hypothetical protein
MSRSVLAAGSVAVLAAWIAAGGPRLELNAMLDPDAAPRSLTLVAFKEERRLEAWGDGRILASYPILAASGKAGPKLREGDGQVPEGNYRLTTLNPRSRFHLSIRVDYPDAEDRLHGCTGTDIYVHGGAASIGCIAIGNEAIEDLFRLAAKVKDRRILIVPWDLRVKPAPEVAQSWMADRYALLKEELERLE